MSEELKVGDLVMIAVKPGYWRVTKISPKHYGPHGKGGTANKDLICLEPVLQKNGKRPRARPALGMGGRSD